MGAEASDFVYEVVKHFLMEALSRIYRPGCKADEMLCLVGQQGAGKSTFFRFLALNDDWFSDDLKQLNDSKIYEHLRGHWIMEMSEMIAAISAKSNEEIKSFLTRQKDTYRNPYDKYEEDRKRQCILPGQPTQGSLIPLTVPGQDVSCRLPLTAVRQRSISLMMKKKPESILASYGQKQWKSTGQRRIRTAC